MDPFKTLPDFVPDEEFNIIGEVVGWRPDILKAIAKKETMFNALDPRDIRLERAYWRKYRFASREAKRMDRRRNVSARRKNWRERRWAQFIEMDRVAQRDAFLNPAVGDAAILCHSFGWPQIMGFNHKVAGFDRAREFLEAMCTLEGQRQAAINFIVETRPVLIAGQKEDFDALGYHWNGPGYKRNRWAVDVANFVAEERFKGKAYV